MDKPGNMTTMEEMCTNTPHSGLHCIRCTFKACRNNWGGWYFMNGVHEEGGGTRQNWGDVPGGGYDLSGARRLTFWARGAQGGEKVSFSCLGMGWRAHAEEPFKPYAGSSPRQSSGYITLEREWKRYCIDLSGTCLTNVIVGFAWETKASVNRFKDVMFYLDDISYDLVRTDLPGFLPSYQTESGDAEFDYYMSNIAYLYDNAVALLAFLASDDFRRAGLLADALVYAQEHDRYYHDGRLRNAYQGGELTVPPGFIINGQRDSVRLPGVWDPESAQWLEDDMALGTYAGNMAWAGLALLAYYEQCGDDHIYLQAAIRIGEWLESHCRDERGTGGYTAGYKGAEPEQQKMVYKSTEHNIDIYVLFERLYLMTGTLKWRNRAAHAKDFFLSMWDQQEGKFWTGTAPDGVTVAQGVIPVDAQAWALLALKDAAHPYARCMEYANRCLRIEDGYDFNQDGDGIWYEGTAQMAVALQLMGHQQDFEQALACLHDGQDSLSGGMYAADEDQITTGFYTDTGEPWLYYRRLHVGATAWMVLVEQCMNPFWMSRGSSGLYACR
jgi:hypothetical protein